MPKKILIVLIGIGMTFSFLVIALIGLSFYKIRQSQTSRDEICDAFPINGNFRIEEFAVKANAMGIRLSVQLDPLTNNDLGENVHGKIYELDQLQEIDQKKRNGSVSVIVGFPMKFVCKIKFSNGKVIDNSRMAFD